MSDKAVIVDSVVGANSTYSTSSVGGSIDLAPNTSSGTVTGLALGSVPKAIILTVRRPENTADIITASVDGNSITPDGFSYGLSAKTPSSGTAYKLEYLCIL